MTVRLLNAAVMPREGRYDCTRLTASEFAEAVNLAYHQHALVSYIGYPNARDVLERLCGVPIALNRESTQLDDCDTMLIARLIYRVGNPAAKGQVQATLDDYEFFECHYSQHA